MRICYERAVATHPDSDDARINLAVWLENDRRLPEAWARSKPAAPSLEPGHLGV